MSVSNSNQEAVKDLPPVTPPSAKFIAQLFLVPGLIVIIAVGILWSFSWLASSERTPQQWINDLSDSNLEARWRTANDLVQVLTKDSVLAGNPKFVIELDELLHKSLGQQTDSMPRGTGEVSLGIESNESAAKGERFILYLISSLGNCTIPAGLPTLRNLATTDWGTTPSTGSLRRQIAIWALANLGDKVKGLDQMPPEERERLVAALEAEGEQAEAEKAKNAHFCSQFVRQRFLGRPMAFGVDRVLDQSSNAQNPLHRKLSAVALSIWQGNETENEQMEKTLLRLSYDDGHGAEDSAALRGAEIRYQAVMGLARRGSRKVVSRMKVLNEMLDEDLLGQTFSSSTHDNQRSTDQDSVISVVTGALRAISELHRQLPELDLAVLRQNIERLSRADNKYLRTEAEKVQLALK
jgi:hypothetical protein